MLWVFVSSAANEALLMSTHNVCFIGEIKEKYPRIINKCSCRSSPSTLQPLYNTVHYNTVLDITRSKMDPKNV